MLFSFFALFIVTAVAQATTTDDPAQVFDLVKNVQNSAEAIGLYGSIYGALVIAFGYFSKFVPFVNKIPSTAYRVLSGGVVIGLIGIKFGLLDNWQVIISFVFSTKLYEYVFSLLKKSDK